MWQSTGIRIATAGRLLIELYIIEATLSKTDGFF